MRILQLYIFLFVYLWATIALGCYESSILKPSPFLGNDGEIVQLSDGTVWEVKYGYNYMYQYYPSVSVCPEKGTFIVEGVEVNVQRLQ